jgi:membrane protease YdiL (CAAX protease family)
MATDAGPPTRNWKPKLVAPIWHTLVLLAASAGLLWMQSRSLAAGGQQQGNVIHYLSVIVAEWVLSLYVWLGGLIPGATRLRDLVGGRWCSMKDVLRDIGIAAAFWVVFVAVGIFMNFLLGPSHVETLGFVNPRGVVEVTLWVMMSMTSGFCEELVFRGYLQRQFLALTGSAALAVLAQAVLFGVAHGYQGSKQVITITLLGLLYGILAQWRKSLRPGIISHAWSDIVNVIPIRFP